MQNNYQISQPLEDATTLQMRSDLAETVHLNRRFSIIESSNTDVLIDSDVAR